MPTVIYFLCTLTSLACTWLLFDGYRRSRHRLLFWSTLCFAGLTLNNLLVVVDRVFFPDAVDLLYFRLGSTLIALLLLLFGLIWQEE